MTLRSELAARVRRRSRIEVRDAGSTPSGPPGPLDGMTGAVLVDLKKIN